MNLELQDAIMNLRILPTSKVSGYSLNISAASLSCHIPLRKGRNSRNPVFPAKRRHIVRSQDSETAPLWLFLSQVLQITPESGIVQPGESIPCFVTLRPSGSASSYSIDVVCEVRPKRYLCIASTWACPAVPRWLATAVRYLPLPAEGILLCSIMVASTSHS